VATATSSSQINLTWTDNSGNETGFKVERSPASGGPWTQIGTTAAASYADSGLASSTTYYYRVRAYGPSGDSGYSNTASATTLAGVPAAPSSLSATAISSSQIDLAWTDNSGNETGFKVERNAAGGAWAEVATPAANSIACTDPGLAPSTSYSYRIRAYNASGNSAYSNTAAASTPAGGASGAHLWSNNFGGPGAIDNVVPLGVAVDGLGEIAMAGYVQGRGDLGTGLLTSAGAGDGFVAKYASNGTPLWSRRFGAAQEDRAKAVAVDGSGNVWVTGLFRGTVDFGGGPVTAVAAGSAFLAKYSSTGAHLLSKRLSVGTAPEDGTALAVDGSGNVLVGGLLYQTSDFGGGPLTSAGSTDIFLVKLSSSGTHIWSRRMGGSGEEWIHGLAVNGSGGPALTGYSTAAADFGGGVLGGAGGKDIIVVQYSSTGAHVWSRRVGGSADEVAWGVSVDGGSNVVVTGNFVSSSINFGAGALANSGGADIFLAKYDSGGSAVWSKRFGTSLTIEEKAFGVATDGAGNIVLTGSIVDALDFGGGLLPGDGYYDIFLAKFTGAGAHVWSRRTGEGAGTEIDADGAGNVIAAGSFSGATTVNFGGANLASPGGTDTFLVKLGP
jgi:hypothetical protein